MTPTSLSCFKSNGFFGAALSPLSGEPPAANSAAAATSFFFFGEDRSLGMALAAQVLVLPLARQQVCPREQLQAQALLVLELRRLLSQ